MKHTFCLALAPEWLISPIISHAPPGEYASGVGIGSSGIVMWSRMQKQVMEPGDPGIGIRAEGECPVHMKKDRCICNDLSLRLVNVFTVRTCS